MIIFVNFSINTDIHYSYDLAPFKLSSLFLFKHIPPNVLVKNPYNPLIRFENSLRKFSNISYFIEYVTNLLHAYMHALIPTQVFDSSGYLYFDNIYISARMAVA